MRCISQVYYTAFLKLNSINQLTFLSPDSQSAKLSLSDCIPKTIEYLINHSKDMCESNVHVHIVHAYIHLSRKTLAL